MAVSGVNSVKPAVVQQEVSAKPRHRHVDTRGAILATAVPTLTSIAYSGKLFFENKGIASVYEGLVNSAAAGSGTVESSVSTCLEIAKKNMKDAKKGAAFVLAAGILAAGGILISKLSCKACRAEKKANKPEPAAVNPAEKNAPKEDKKADKKVDIKA